MDSIVVQHILRVLFNHCWTDLGYLCIINELQWRDILEFLPIGLWAEGGMGRIWQSTPESTVIWFAVLAILVAVSYYVIEKIRPKPVQKERKANEWLSKFRELHSQGDLSDEEFRTIKTTLAVQLQDELKDNGGRD